MLSSSSPSPSTPLSSPCRIDTLSPISQQQQQQQPQLICLDAHQTQLVLEATREQLITLGCPSTLMEDNSIVNYIHRMINNKRPMTYIATQLEQFMGRDSATQFVKWLCDFLIQTSSTLLPHQIHSPNREQSTADNTTSSGSGSSGSSSKQPSSSHSRGYHRNKLSFNRFRHSSSIFTAVISSSRSTTITTICEGDTRSQVLDDTEMRNYYQELHKQNPELYPRYESVYEFSQLSVRRRLGTTRWLIERNAKDLSKLLSDRDLQYNQMREKTKQENNRRRRDKEDEEYERSRRRKDGERYRSGSSRHKREDGESSSSRRYSDSGHRRSNSYQYQEKSSGRKRSRSEHDRKSEENSLPAATNPES